ncbi:hypothetical protein FS837_006485 [Tulasnella sp. UAMH 9824]|nr:hypothetical protein FS837_006485 [Tulasnella sp. UAMH 9824]
MLGTGMCDVTRKFLEKTPEDATDLPYDDFMARKQLIEHVLDYDETRTRGKAGGDPAAWEWTPILYVYEIAKGSTKRQEDVGHVVFVDPTLTRFLMVNLYGPPTCQCGNPYHNDYSALVALHANRFMSLLKYVYYDPENPQAKWIRATYTTNAQRLNPAFLVPANTDNPPPVSSNQSSDHPPIINVLSGDFIPSLNDHHFQRIDAILAETRAGVFYCNQKCQKEHWRTHKVFCKEPPLATAPPKPTVQADTITDGEPPVQKPKRERRNKKPKDAAESSVKAEGSKEESVDPTPEVD